MSLSQPYSSQFNDDASNRTAPNFIQDINFELSLLGLVSIVFALLVWMIGCCLSKSLGGSRPHRVRPRSTRCALNYRPPYYLLLLFWVFSVGMQAVRCAWIVHSTTLLTMFALAIYICTHLMHATQMAVRSHFLFSCFCSGIYGTITKVSLRLT